jgi:hypothetical protein
MYKRHVTVLWKGFLCALDGVLEAETFNFFVFGEMRKEAISFAR